MSQIDKTIRQLKLCQKVYLVMPIAADLEMDDTWTLIDLWGLLVATYGESGAVAILSSLELRGRNVLRLKLIVTSTKETWAALLIRSIGEQALQGNTATTVSDVAYVQPGTSTIELEIDMSKNFESMISLPDQVEYLSAIGGSSAKYNDELNNEKNYSYIRPGFYIRGEATVTIDMLSIHYAFWNDRGYFNI